MFQFSHVLSVAALASVAVAAPQYYYPALSPTYYTTGIAQPAAIAQPVAVEVIIKLARTPNGVLACKITIFLPDPPQLLSLPWLRPLTSPVFLPSPASCLA